MSIRFKSDLTKHSELESETPLQSATEEILRKIAARIRHEYYNRPEVQKITVERILEEMLGESKDNTAE